MLPSVHYFVRVATPQVSIDYPHGSKPRSIVGLPLFDARNCDLTATVEFNQNIDLGWEVHKFEQLDDAEKFARHVVDAVRTGRVGDIQFPSGSKITVELKAHCKFEHTV